MKGFLDAAGFACPITAGFMEIEDPNHVYYEEAQEESNRLAGIPATDFRKTEPRK
jgi:hypothetical protein